MPQPNTLLTWADVLKLCVPFAFALVLIWAKLAYENRLERNAKRMSLWRSISDAQGNFIRSVDTIGRIATAASANKLVTVTFDIPGGLVEFANRLAELDTYNAHIYISYSSHIQIVLSGIESLKALNVAYIQSLGGETRERLVKAMGCQAAAVRKDLLTLARRELDVLEIIRQAEPSFDRQIVDKQKKIIEDISSTIDRHVA
jgi:hypothetical protein